MAQKYRYPMLNNPGKPKAVRIWRWIVLPYPFFIFLMLCAGVILLAWTAHVAGINILTRAKVPAPALTQPAVIELPSDGTTLTTIPANISGICPVDSYVEIFRNDVFAGTVLCSAGGTFQMAIDLLSGANKLQAQDYNITDDAGPSSGAISVNYSPPPAPAPNTVSTTITPIENPQPYILNTDGKFQYNGYYTGQTVVLHLTTGGGQAPYVFTVDWGDNDPVYTIYKPGPFTLTHTYTRAGEFRGSHTIRINSTDAAGNKTFLQLFVIVNSLSPASSTSSPSTIIKPITASLNHTARWLWVAWPAYGVVLLMAVSYRLGEREELILLHRH
jgi:hypothetical protein